MQTLLYAFHKDIISLNLHNNSLGVDICSLTTNKKKMSSENYTSCPNHIAKVDPWFQSSFHCTGFIPLDTEARPPWKMMVTSF